MYIKNKTYSPKIHHQKYFKNLYLLTPNESTKTKVNHTALKHSIFILILSHIFFMKSFLNNLRSKTIQKCEREKVLYYFILL